MLLCTANNNSKKQWRQANFRCLILDQYAYVVNLGYNRLKGLLFIALIGYNQAFNVHNFLHNKCFTNALKIWGSATSLRTLALTKFLQENGSRQEAGSNLNRKRKKVKRPNDEAPILQAKQEANLRKGRKQSKESDLVQRRFSGSS
jgi:hypothetical protein